MFGPQPAPQPVQRLSWQDYLDRIKNGPAPQYSPPSNAQQPQGPGTAAGFSGGSSGSGGISSPFSGIMSGKGGGHVTSQLPATPIDYGRMSSILNSGVLEGGHAPTSADIPPQQAAPAPAQPAPAPAQPQNPFQAFMTSLMSGGK